MVRGTLGGAWDWSGRVHPEMALGEPGTGRAEISPWAGRSEVT